MLSRSFRYYQLANLVALMGDQIGLVALSWWVLIQTDSVASFANILAASMATRIIGMPLLAPYADRFCKRTVMLFADGISALVAIIILILMINNVFSLSWLIFLSTISGLASACFRSASAGIIPSLVKKKELGIAMAQNQSFLTFSHILGAPLGGILVAWLGVSSTWALNILFIVIAMLATTRLRLLAQSKTEGSLNTRQSWITSLGCGIRFVREQPIIWSSALFVAATMIAIAPMAVVIPYFATKGFDMPPWYLGALHGSLATGSVIFALLVRRLDKYISPVTLTLSGLGLVGMVWVFMALLSSQIKQTESNSWIFVIVLCVIFGFAEMMALIPIRSRVMATIPHRLLGRVMAVLQFLTQALVPLSMWAAAGALDRISLKWVSIGPVFILLVTGLTIGSTPFLRRFLATPLDDLSPHTTSRWLRSVGHDEHESKDAMTNAKPSHQFG